MNFAIDTPIPEHLLQFERAARLYCAHQNLDPDDTVKVPHPIMVNTLVDSWPQWTNIAQRMYDLSGLLAAMKLAVAEEQAAKGPVQ